MVHDALNVSSVTSEKFIPCRFFGRVFSGVICRVSVGKAVRHNQINHVTCSKTLPLCRTFAAGGYLVWILEDFRPVVKDYPVCARSGILRNFHIDEEIVRAVSLVHSRNGNSFSSFHTHIAGRYVLSPHKQLERCFHSGPPRKRLNPFHAGTGISDRIRVERSLFPAGDQSYGR